MEGQAVQIVKYNRERKEFELDKPALQGVINSEGVKDANLAIVSISGAIRKGKSFILSFFLRYLNETFEKNNTNWLCDEFSPLAGFAWRGGSERHTTGIWVWSKIFTKTLPSGEKIGVMLMDTQGTFDNKSTIQDNVTVFALSAMLSSVQIYNVFNNIQQDDLENLQLFTEYGKLAKERTTFKAFQRLLFLVRDWNFPYELPFGSTGGAQLLNEVLNENDNTKSAEIINVRKHIRACYDTVEGFLMPYPGKIVTHSESFQGRLADIDDDFKNNLKVLAPFILEPGKLTLKLVNGNKVQAQNMLAYFESYVNVFKNRTLPTPESVLKATIAASINNAKAKALDHYENSMKSITGPEKGYLQVNVLAENHTLFSQQALEIFKKGSLVGDAALWQTENDDLMRYFLKRLVIYQQQNEGRRNTDLTNKQNDLQAQINNYQNTHNAQQGTVNNLTNQANALRQAGDNELAQLRNQLQAVRQSLGMGM